MYRPQGEDQWGCEKMEVMEERAEYCFGNSLNTLILCFLLETWNQTRHLYKFCCQNGIGGGKLKQKKVSLNSTFTQCFGLKHFNS